MDHNFINDIVTISSTTIGIIGIGIIVFGVFYSLWTYVFTKKGKNSINARVCLNQHLILGLDFLVGKDIIDTFLLAPGNVQWIDLATLATVVSIRIILSHFLEKEIENIQKR